MICLSPGIDKKFGLIPPINLDVRFILDNIQIIPEDSILTILNDPIYHPFDDYIQQINSTNIIQFKVENKKAFLSLLINNFSFSGN